MLQTENPNYCCRDHAASMTVGFSRSKRKGGDTGEGRVASGEWRVTSE
jgi:hypothetical protein